jgi:hypothetical protein
LNVGESGNRMIGSSGHLKALPRIRSPDGPITR